MDWMSAWDRSVELDEVWVGLRLSWEKWEGIGVGVAASLTVLAFPSKSVDASSDWMSELSPSPSECYWRWLRESGTVRSTTCAEFSWSENAIHVYILWSTGKSTTQEHSTPSWLSQCRKISGPAHVVRDLVIYMCLQWWVSPAANRV